MLEVETEDLLAGVPRWWSEPVFGLLATLSAIIGIYGETAVVEWLIRRAFRIYASGFVVGSLRAFVAALALLGVVYAVVGLGSTYWYLTARGMTDSVAVALPDRTAAHWLTALAWLAPTLVALAMLVDRVVPGFPGGLIDPLPITNAWDVPAALVVAGQPTGLPTLFDGEVAVTAPLTVALVGGVAGPALGALFHGVLQTTLRRVARPAVAVGATAVVLATVTVTLADLLGFAVALAFAAAAGWAYERTGNLVVPLAAYAVLNTVVAATAAVVFALEVGQL